MDCIDLTTSEGRAAWEQIQREQRTPKRAKYGNVRTPTDAGMADSKVEAARWAELRMLERAGVITGLRFHPRYVLPGGVVYEGDSEYVDADRQLVCEDVKGKTAPLTSAFKIKARLFRERYPDIQLRIERR